MRETWYVTGFAASTTRRLSIIVVFAMGLASTAAPGCGTGTSATSAPQAVGLVAGPAPAVAATTTVTLAGARCTSGTCRCREPGQDDVETQPPGPGSKRFEVRMSATGGSASLDLSELGTVATGPEPPASGEEAPRTQTTCVYLDVPAGSTHQARFVALESTKGQGIAPHLTIAEYGPAGPYWYDILTVSCAGTNGRCDRAAADAWGQVARGRQRGRVDPCGSAVVTKLGWESSGGQAARDGGLFRDFAVRFTMEVKKFATQFAPGSSECVPK